MITKNRNKNLIRLPRKAQPVDTDTYRSIIWRGRWIQNHRFALLPYRNIYSGLRNDENASEIRNVHTFFRKSWHIKNKAIRTAHLYITADDTYKLYINGEFAGLGPAQSFPFSYAYNVLDITGFVKSGEELLLAIHVYYLGLFTHSYLSADNLQGLLVQLEIQYEDGFMERMVSDSSWKYLDCDAWTGRLAYGYNTQFTEDIDLRKIPRDWREKGFDDSGWTPAYVRAAPYPSPYTLVPQSTPTLDYIYLHPETIRKIDAGHYIIDFGSEITGTSVFKLRGKPGQIVEIRHSEEMLNENEVRFELRANCQYQEFVTLTGDADTIEFFDSKGFRYMEVLNWPQELSTSDMWAINTFYPYPGKAGFNSSEPMLDDIWQLCENGVIQGTQDTYIDCPTREKGGVLGDAYICANSHLLLANDTRLLKKVITDFANSLRNDPGMTAVAPTYSQGGNIEYTSLWPMLIEKYYMWTGDSEFVSNMLYGLDCIIEYNESWEDEHGFIKAPYGRTPPHYSGTLIDWPPNLRFDYDYERAKDGVSTVVNLYYYGFIKSCINLFDIAGEDERVMYLRQKLKRLEKNCIAYLYSEEKGLFIDYLGSKNTPYHASPMAMSFGMPLPGGYGPIARQIADEGLRCGVYFAYFVIKGLFNAGYYELAYSLITSRSEYSWYSMLKAGATTCMEVWSPDMKSNTSWCHPWSSSPIIFIAENIIGLSPAIPGWGKVYFRPRPPKELDRAELKLDTPSGVIIAGFCKAPGRVEYIFELEKAVSFILEFTDIQPEISIDMESIRMTELTDEYGNNIARAEIILSADTHIITTSLRI